jgi:hypothetical protein
MRRLLLLALAFLAGCHSWKPSDLTPAATLAEKPRTEIRVITPAGRTVVQRPSVVGDSLVGSTSAGSALRRYAVALRDVTRVDVRRLDRGKTVAVLGGVVLVGIAIASAATDEPEPQPHPDASCPLVYSRQGDEWRLDSGTFGGAITRALQRTDVDNLDFATPHDGRLLLRVANELRETDHVDALGVTLIEHEHGIVTAPDPAGGVHGFRAPLPPVRATDFRGEDVLEHVRALDQRNWVSRPAGRDTSRAADVRDGIELAFLRPAGATAAHLVMDGNNTLWATYLLTEFISAHAGATAAWYDSLDADPAHARRMFAPLAREGFLTASVWQANEWIEVGQFWEAGPEIVKRQVLHLDLRGVRGDTVHVRLESVPSFWLVDQVGMAFGPDEALRIRDLPLASAVGSEGRDVRDDLASIDGRYLTLETGDFAELAFEVPRPEAAERTFLLRSTGWYRIRTSERGAPAVAFLDRLATEPLAVSRSAVGKLNAGIAELRAGATP